MVKELVLHNLAVAIVMIGFKEALWKGCNKSVIQLLLPCLHHRIRRIGIRIIVTTVTLIPFNTLCWSGSADLVFQHTQHRRISLAGKVACPHLVHIFQLDVLDELKDVGLCPHKLVTLGLLVEALDQGDNSMVILWHEMLPAHSCAKDFEYKKQQ